MPLAVSAAVVEMMKTIELNSLFAGGIAIHSQDSGEESHARI
jgi:hypothetical protein